MKHSTGEILHRLDQGLRALRPVRIPADRDLILAESLSPEQTDAFRQLPPYDQAHLLDVRDRLRQVGASRDLLVAGLLHDIGKVSDRGRVRTVDRVARILLRRTAPRLLAHLSNDPNRHLLHGLHLCIHHPRLGADRAERLGCTARTIWLIAHHEDRDPGDDAELIALQRADRGK